MFFLVCDSFMIHGVLQAMTGLNGFLEGHTLQTASVSEKEKFLFQQLLKSREVGENQHQYRENPRELLSAISKLGPRQVCQYQFKTNDIVWICRECQKVMLRFLFNILM